MNTQSPVLVNNSTANRKLGNMAVTYASQVSCPSDCAWRRNGCYAESGPVSWAVTTKLNRAKHNAYQTAQLEARGIDSLPGDKPLRVHVVGDCTTDRNAQTVSAAADRYTNRMGFGAYTYTHAWDRVERDSWGGMSVLASCETHDQVERAHARGYAAAIVVSEHTSARAEDHAGYRYIPCPQQTKDVTCDQCGLCQKDKWLHAERAVITFAAHGAGAKKVRETLVQLGAKV